MIIYVFDTIVLIGLYGKSSNYDVIFIRVIYINLFPVFFFLFWFFGKNRFALFWLLLDRIRLVICFCCYQCNLWKIQMKWIMNSSLFFVFISFIMLNCYFILLCMISFLFTRKWYDNVSVETANFLFDLIFVGISINIDHIVIIIFFFWNFVFLTVLLLIIIIVLVQPHFDPIINSN